MSSQIPSQDQRLRAIGSVPGLPIVLQRALAPAQAFEPMAAPGPSDWLTAHPEPGQGFEQFVRSQPNQPDKARRIIYLQPLGEFREGQAPSLDSLRDYAAAYFALEVRIQP